MTQNTKLLAIAGMLGTVLLGLALLTGGAAAADEIDRTNLTNGTATVNYSVGDTLEVSALFADAPANATISIKNAEPLQVNFTDGTKSDLFNGTQLWTAASDKKTINVTQTDLYDSEIWVTRTFSTGEMASKTPESFNRSDVELAVTFTDDNSTDDRKIDNSITEVHEPGGGGGILAGTSSGQTLLLGLAALGGLFWAVRSDTL
jgi:hypothetical protein